MPAIIKLKHHMVVVIDFPDDKTLDKVKRTKEVFDQTFEQLHGSCPAFSYFAMRMMVLGCEEILKADPQEAIRQLYAQQLEDLENG